MANNGWFRLEANSMGTSKASNKSIAHLSAALEKTKKEEHPIENPLADTTSPSENPPASAVPLQQNISHALAAAPGLDDASPEIKEAAHSGALEEQVPALPLSAELRETLEAFVRSKTIDQVVHTKGFGAFGYFEPTHSMQQYTSADIFQFPGPQTPVLTRFSLAISNKGTPDTKRNIRGFSTKFYAKDSVFDLLCNHIPVFPVRDAIRFPEAIQAFLPSPKNNLSDPERFWGFVARAPEATHFVTWLYSDVGTIKSFRHMRGYGVNTYVWKNAAGKRHYIKYHWIPMAGEVYIDRQEATLLAGTEPDIAGRDLYDTIARGTPVEYELCVQAMDPADAAALPYDPLDDTKVWDEWQYPLLPVGKLVLGRNPDDYIEQIEKAAFSPSNLLDGIEFSQDRMLQGRSFIYQNAQRHRLEPESHRIPTDREAGFAPGQPVTGGEGQDVEDKEMWSELPKTDHFTQAGERYHALSTGAQERLADNIASELHLVSNETQATVLGYFRQASEELALRVRQQMERYAKK